MRLAIILISATMWLATTLAFPLRNPSDGAHPKYQGALQRRTDQPPERKLPLSEYYDKSMKVRREIAVALDQNPTLKRNVERVLGVEDLERLGPKGVTHAEMNNALRQAGYEGELLPTSEEMENYTEEDIQEFVGETERTLEEMMRRLEADPFVMGKVLIALGINRGGSWPSNVDPRKLNKALRKAGYRGPFLPENPKKKGRGFGRPQGPRDGINRYSLDENPQRSGILSKPLRSFGEFLGKKLEGIGRISRPAGSPSHAAPFLPVRRPFGPLVPIK